LEKRDAQSAAAAGKLLRYKPEIQTMRYVEFPPSPELSPLVDCYWILEGSGFHAPEPVVPDGRVELIFHYGAPFTRHRSSAPGETQARALVAGQIVSPVMLSTPHDAGVAAVRLRPAAAATVLRTRAEAVTEQICALDGVLSVGAVPERLALSSGDAERVAVLECWLGSMRLTEPRRDVSAAVQMMLRTGGRASIDVVSKRSELSRRQMERLFLEHVGLSPKTFARVVRLRRAVSLVRRGGALASVAAACGYYDQPHMTRDFRQLLKGSPAEWQGMRGGLGALFAD
jgi:AraC-like DNA-binding protein